MTIKLLILRHNESIANNFKIIQGQIFDSGLTIHGKTNTNKLLNILSEKKCNRIITSPSRRTIETASIISLGLNIPLTSDKLLQEVDSGILSGRSHNFCSFNLPKEYEIWNKRKNLSGIKFSESEKYIQSRVLLFLFEFFNSCIDENVIIVTHAATKRCLINTINNKEVNNSIDVSHNHIESISNPWDKIPHTVIENNDRNVIIKVLNKYILKKSLLKKDRDYIGIVYLQNYIAKKLNYAPEIFNSTFETVNDKLFFSKIEEYRSGNHCSLNDLSNSCLKKIFLNVLQIMDLASEKLKEKKYCTFHYYMFSILENAKEKKLSTSSVKTMEKILKSLTNEIIECNRIILWDLHKYNILCEDDKITFIDFENTFLGNEEMQVGSILACNILLEINSSNFKKTVNKILNIWPKKLDPLLVKKAIVLKACTGSIYFTLKEKSLSLQEKNILKKYNEIILFFDNTINE